MIDPQDYDPPTCSHGFTRSEGCGWCQGITRWADRSDEEREVEMVADYPHADGLF